MLRPSYDVLIAEDADAFTSALLKLMRQPADRNTLIEHADQTMAEYYSRSVVKEELGALTRSLGL
jgi:hypothetical protein